MIDMDSEIVKRLVLSLERFPLEVQDATLAPLFITAATHVEQRQADLLPDQSWSANDKSDAPLDCASALITFSGADGINL